MDKADSLSLIRQKLQDYLRLNSLRSTPERTVLLETVYTTDAPFSAEEMSAWMQEKSRMRISRATVYNNLGLFENAGLVRKIFVNDKVLYERTDKSKGTIRLICGSCGKTTEMNDERLRRQIGEMRTRRFTMTGWSLNVYGMCSKCTTSLKRKESKLKNKTDKTK